MLPELKEKLKANNNEQKKLLNELQEGKIIQGVFASELSCLIEEASVILSIEDGD